MRNVNPEWYYGWDQEPAGDEGLEMAYEDRFVAESDFDPAEDGIDNWTGEPTL